MRPMRLLVAEGNTARARAKQAEFYGATYSQSYADVLRSITPDAIVDICFPADEGANLPDPDGLGGYDGVAVTGSALNIYEMKPESVRQIEFARAVYQSGVPFFGSCWGLQLATVAAGGTVVRSLKGREIGLARKITVTDDGRNHGLHHGKDSAFDAPAVHTDEVGVRPTGMTVTATNGFSAVQAAEIRNGAGIFWGVQYHPEFTLSELAAIMVRYGEILVKEGPFRSLDELNRHVGDLRALDGDPGRVDIAWRLGIDADILDPVRRVTEIRNWIERMVRPWMSRRGRA
jgi:GMP synthase (glutamine-hydrolysing)